MTAERGGAVVTGAGRGLGSAIATMLARRGFALVVTDLEQSAAEASAAAIRAATGGSVTAMAVDVREESQCAAAAAEAVRRAGRLALWVNNAGVLLTGPAWEQDEASRRLMQDVNSTGTVNGTVVAIRAMRRTGGGHIVNIASLAGLAPVPGEGVYAGTKHAVLGFSLSTQADLRIAGIRDVTICCICPDGIWTPMLHDKLDDPAAALSFSGRLLQPEDVVRAVERVLDRPRYMRAVPRWRGAHARLFGLAPEVAIRLAPIVVRQGRWAQKRYARKGLAPGSSRGGRRSVPDDEHGGAVEGDLDPVAGSDAGRL